MRSISASLPTSSDPWQSDLAIEAAALSVAATSASGMLRRSRTQAKCMTIGCNRNRASNGGDLVRGLGGTRSAH